MTRQKKELEKQIRWLYDMVAADEELGCGFAPAGAYAETEKQIYGLEEQLAKLRGYGSVEEMHYDPRGQVEGFPFA